VLAAQVGAQRGMSIVDFPGDPQGADLQRLPGRRQGDAARMAIEQLHAERLFEIGNPPRNRRLGDVEIGGRGPKAAGIRYRQKIPQMAQIEAFESCALFHHAALPNGPGLCSMALSCRA
jgi:hypothetical protein